MAELPPNIYDSEEIRTVERDSLGLRLALQDDQFFDSQNPDTRAPRDIEEANQLVAQLIHKYRTGQCVMIRDEDNPRRWHYVKIVQCYGWWLSGCYAPTYVISFGNGDVQNCLEDEIWPLSQVLKIGQPKPKKRRPKKNPRPPQSNVDTMTREAQQLLGSSQSNNIAVTDSFVQCFCGTGQCDHSNCEEGSESVEDEEEGEYVEVNIDDNVF